MRHGDEALSDDMVAGSYRVGEREQGLRLDRFLVSRIPKLTRQRIRDAIGTRVRVPGRARLRPALRLRPGDLVLVLRAEPESGPFGFAPRLLYSDADLVVVDKPAGIPVHATRRVVAHHLVGWLRQCFGPELALAHRLDRETSGVLVATRNGDSARVLARAFASGAVRKRYLAVVRGRVETELRIDAPIGPDRSSAVHIRQAVVDDGRPAVSLVRPLRLVRDRSLVCVRPLNGRRHQIRVHLAHAGHPIVGDKLYAAGERHFLNFITRGEHPALLAELGAARQLLHAWQLELGHPRDGRRLRFEAPPPDDMSLPCEPWPGPAAAGSA